MRVDVNGALNRFSRLISVKVSRVSSLANHFKLERSHNLGLV
jgi:hypothetical protein